MYLVVEPLFRDADWVEHHLHLEQVVNNSQLQDNFTQGRPAESAMSQLATQLRALSKGSSSKPLSKPSLLFSQADVDTHTVFELGQNGFGELQLLDERFGQFESLFRNTDSKVFDRGSQTTAKLAILDSLIEGILQLLSPYLLLKPAHKTLEYLIRRYQIIEKHQEALIACILPFHQTDIFGRLVQFMKLPPQWSFLKSSPDPLVRRSVIVQQCIDNISILDFICKMAKNSTAGRTPQVTFFTVVVMEVLGTYRRDPDKLILLLLPYINHGLSMDKHADLHKSSLMLIAFMGSRFSINENVLEALAVRILGTIEQDASECLLPVISLIQSQHKLPKKVFDRLRSIPNILDVLETLQQAFNLEEFLSLLVPRLIEEIQSNEVGQAEEMLIQLIKSVPKSQAPNMLRTLFDTSFSRPNYLSAYARLLCSFEQSHPGAVDEVIQQELTSQSPPRRKVVLQLVKKAIPHSRHHVLEDFGLTLLLALEHPKPEVRLSAVNALGYVHEDAIRDRLVEKINDPDPTIRRSVLENSNLVGQVNNTLLLQSLLEVLEDPASGSNLVCLALRQLGFVVQHEVQSEFISRLLSCTLHFLSACDKEVREAATSVLRAKSTNLRDIFEELCKADFQPTSDFPQQLQIVVAHLSNAIKKPDAAEFFISSIASSHATYTSGRMLGLCVLTNAMSHSPSLGPRFLDLIVQIWNTIPPRERVISTEEAFQVHGVPSLFPSPSAVLASSLLCILESCNVQESSSHQVLLQSLFIFAVTVNQDFGRFLLAQICQRLRETNFKLLFPFWLAKRNSSTHCMTSLGAVPTAAVVASYQIMEVSLGNLDPAMILPCVLVGLGNGSKAVRCAALSVVRGLQTKRTQAQSLFALTTRLREEFLADELFLTNNFTAQTPTLDAATLNYVCDTLLNFLKQGHAYANTLIVSFLRIIPVAVLAKGTFPVLLDLLQLSSLSPEEKTLVPLLVAHITHESFSNPSCFSLLVAVLRSPLILEGNTSVSGKGLQQIDSEFFKACTVVQQNELFQCLCELTKRPETLNARQVLERVCVDASLLLPHVNLALEYLAKNGDTKNMSLARVTTLVEVLQMILPANKLHGLVLPLFDLLAATFRATSHPPGEIEFIKQLLLTGLLQYFKQTRFDEKLKSKLTSLSLFSLVDCVTPSVVNEPLRSQTRNSALLLYSAIAPVFPQAAQDVVLRMFDFQLGAMDSHSFAVIQQTVETVLPPILHMVSIDSLIPMFVEMACTISANQALRLLTVLHTTLSRCVDTLPASFLHESVAWLLQKMTDDQEVKEEHDSLFSEPAFLHLLYRGFSLAEQVASLVALVDIVVKSESATKATKMATVIKKLQTKERVQKWQACVLEFVGAQLGHPSFVERSGEGGVVEQYYVKLFERLFALSRLLKESKSPRKDSAQLALNRLNQLLSLPMFVSVVKVLLADSEPGTQRRALQLLQDKVSKKRQDDEALLVAVLPCLQALILETTDDQMLSMVFTCVQTLCGCSPGVANKEVLELLPKLQQWISRRLSDERPEKRKVAVQGIKCLGSVASHLGLQLVPHLQLLSGMITLVLDWLELSFKSSSPEFEPVFYDIRLSALGSLQAIISAVPSFVSPYLKRIITALIHPLLSDGSQASMNTQATLTAMSTSIDARVLLPVVFSSWQSSISLGSSSVQRLCWFLGVIESHFTSQVARTEYKGIFQFLLQSFDIRRSHPMVDMDLVEDTIVTATVNILLKLRETELKSLFMGVLDWLNVLNDADCPNVSANMDRYVIFFRLVLQLSVTLKSVFVPYFNYFVNLCIQILRLPPEKVQSKKKRTAEGNERSLQSLVQSLIIRSLHQTFMGDTNRALPRDFFDRLMEPLVEQLPNEAVGPCLEELVARLGSHVLWKPLNRLVLLKTRSSSVLVRLAAVNLLTKFFTRFGENWLVLLPETLSYIAELMEDQEQEVQRAVQTLIQTIEQLSGESLASAFT